MGRGRQKVKIEFIRDKKERNETFKKRKLALAKSLHDLATLCGVDACMVIYPDDQQQAPEIFSNKPDGGMIDYYRTNKDNPNKHKSFGLCDFLGELMSGLPGLHIQVLSINSNAASPKGDVNREYRA